MNIVFAVALAVIARGDYWPVVRLSDLVRADLQPSSSISIAHAPAVKTPLGAT